MLAAVTTFSLDGIGSREVTVEVDARRGLPTFTLVGLADRAVRESRERVRAALLNSGLEFPQQRLAANLAPAHVHKHGATFDLAIAVGLLAATAQVPHERLASHAVCGELSLSGRLRPVRGALAFAVGAKRAGYDHLIVPEENAEEAALVAELDVLAVPDLRRIVDLLRGEWAPDQPPRAERTYSPPAPELELRDVRGHPDAKRALEIAAAGGHNLLMIGPPGAGKTMLARRLPAILPPLSFEEALEVTQIHSAAGLGSGRLVSRRPFRSPHHTVSPQGLVGGGSPARPGEVTLAHRGVLFLDELAEFSRAALDAMRQPARGGTRRDRAGAALGLLSGPRNARRRLQQLSLRATDDMRVQRAGAGPLHAEAQRSPARPDRPRLPHRRSTDGRARGRGRRHASLVIGRGPRQGLPGPRPSA
ncbi:MAG TPA: YifB family Mg chelatase-like AAA ATPase [Thermoleophilaceae bacterium]|nr:YifB family Mg chelatase-like AAA ATPase [Thermoleophilaceae bacterium]